MDLHHFDRNLLSRPQSRKLKKNRKCANKFNGMVEKKGFVVAIDGPAASGKSTTARLLAQHFNMNYVDTGAMYRAVALAVLENGVSLENVEQVKELLNGIDIRTSWSEEQFKVFLNSRDVTTTIRNEEVTEIVSHVARLSVVRKYLVELQRLLGSDCDVIMEGRDIGTVVFPDADLKFFITADLETRSLRRKTEVDSRLSNSGDLGAYVETIERRDSLDKARKISPLRVPAGAILLDTTNLSIEKQVAALRTLIEEKLAV